MRVLLCLALVGSGTGLLLATDTTSAEDYSFDPSVLQVKPLEVSGNVELYPTLQILNAASPQYRLRYPDSYPASSDGYHLKSEGFLQYHRKPFLVSLSGSLRGDWMRGDDSLFLGARLYEGYVKYAPSPSLSFFLGKRALRWGKGYAFNPIAFASRPKDLNDIDAALEGYWDVSVELIKSLDLRLATIAANVALLPVYQFVNRGYLPGKGAAGVGQLYLLVANTDVDFCFYGDNGGHFKMGVDFSRNLCPDWEIHGEWAFVPAAKSAFFKDETTLVSQARSAHSVVAGTRYLAPCNTTFILEYLHVGSGHAPEQIEAYYRALDYSRTAGAVAQRSSVLKTGADFYSSQFIGNDYLYIKASHPDPFNFVYFTPDLYSIVNLRDGSLMGGVEMSYNRWRHLLLTLRYIALLGAEHSEYGARLGQHRLELRAKWSF
jgi:hypothetical protein